MTSTSGEKKMTNSLPEYWAQAWADTQEDMKLRLGGDVDESTFRSANKRKPEDKAWWYTNGLEMLKNYKTWRDNTDWKIWTTTSGEPAIELNMNITLGDGLVKMTLDRVMELPNKELVVLDLKTGSRTPDSVLQLAFYAVGVEVKYGVRPKYGSYWMARKGEPTPIVDLSWFTKDKMHRLTQEFNRARREHMFLPNLTNCSRCGYTKHCEWYRKDES